MGTKEVEIASLAKMLHYAGARPAVESKGGTNPYSVRLRYDSLPKDSYAELFGMGHLKVCSVVIGNEGIDVQFNDEKLARAFANGLTVILKEVI